MNVSAEAPQNRGSLSLLVNLATRDTTAQSYGILESTLLINVCAWHRLDQAIKKHLVTRNPLHGLHDELSDGDVAKIGRCHLHCVREVPEELVVPGHALLDVLRLFEIAKVVIVASKAGHLILGKQWKGSDFGEAGTSLSALTCL
jgi:hypothetical protein